MLAASDIYRTLFRTADIPFSLQVRADVADRTTIALSLQRPRSSGEASEADRRLVTMLIAPIADAVQAARVLGQRIDGEMLATAESVAGPVLLVDADLRIVSLSGAAEPVLRAGSWVGLRCGALAIDDDRSRVALEQAVRAVTGGRAHLRGTRRVVIRARGRRGLPVDVCALPERLSGPLSPARALLVLRPPEPVAIAPMPCALAPGHGLTPAETDVAAALASGLTVFEVAERRGSSISTVRTQVKVILGKTGFRRQAELILAYRASA